MAITKYDPPKHRRTACQQWETPYLAGMGFQVVGISKPMPALAPAPAPAPVVAWCGGPCGEARAAFWLVSYGHFPISIRIPPLGPNHGKKESLASATQRHPGDQASCPFV
jgi:hypothetical protein